MRKCLFLEYSVSVQAVPSSIQEITPLRAQNSNLSLSCEKCSFMKVFFTWLTGEVNRSK